MQSLSIWVSLGNLLSALWNIIDEEAVYSNNFWDMLSEGRYSDPHRGSLVGKGSKVKC